MSAETGGDPNAIGQFGAALGVGVGAGLLGLWQWVKGLRGEQEEKRKVVIEGLELADMRPVRKVAGVLEEAVEIVPLIRDGTRLLTDLHAKRDKADATIAAMHAEFAATLARIEARLQVLEVEIRVLARIAEGRG